ncbi:MAG: T9SS C-terminal target domain-containing protein [Flavobacteriales bacterium]|nr:T9SS C-terminal target domain-containing protein [Flavobacteriales bacterium]
MRVISRVLLLIAFATVNSFAEKPTYVSGKTSDTSHVAAKLAIPASTLAGCAEPNGVTIMDFNNIRARIYTGGDMFWDKGLGSAAYEVPKGSGKHSMFLASLWLGGTDVNGQLRLAAQRFTSSGSDFYTGPLDTSGTAEISPEVCAAWDKHFTVYRAEVDQHVARCQEGDCGDIPKSILNWPAHGDANQGQSYYLAPFIDVDGDGAYNPEVGDYPAYDLSTDIECNRDRNRDVKLYGDMTIWWVFNDKGDVHGETEADAIGVEIHTQQFAFATNDEINNMLFTNYRIINRSTYTLIETYFGTNFDPDLGDAFDDYVGCDVQRGLGYCYNGNACDPDYGCGPPAIGIDFFEGPYQDSDGEDNPTGGCDASINGLNFGDGVVDNERWGMRRFVYYVNASCATICDPDQGSGTQYYNYLKGNWKDGTPMLYGGNGHVAGCDNPFTCAPANFMFPGDTDPCGWGTGGIPQNEEWSEQAVGTPPGDRRFVHSAGPFTLEPGAENDITVGVIWARSTSSDPFLSVELVRQADDKAQALFDNCFRVLDGPDAPEITIQELDQELILYISNPKNANNANEDYVQVDPLIVEPGADNKYRFQGYQIYQLRNYNNSISDITDIEQARLVAQIDLKDDITKLVNKEFSELMGADVPTLMVDGENKGIRHSFKLTEDLFALGDKKLINHKDYYFIAVAYAYNQYEINGEDGNKKPYLASRKNGYGMSIEPVRGFPHQTGPEEYGTIINSEYGDGPEITRNEGHGNGGHSLLLAQESIDRIMTFPWKSESLTYQRRMGPIDVKIVNPLEVRGGKYAIKLHYDEADQIDIKKVQYQPPVLTGINYFGVESDARDKIAPGDKIAITGSTFNDGTYTILKLDSTGTRLYVEETIPDTLSDGFINPGYKWILLSGNNLAETLFVSTQFIKSGSEIVVADHGFSVTLRQASDPGPTYSIATDLTSPSTMSAVIGVDNPGEENGFISGSLEFEDPKQAWLTGIADGDAPNALNWIRSGTSTETGFVDYTLDEDEVYENVVGGTWAPYCLASKDSFGPALDFKNINKSDIGHLASIDLVFTADKSKWTRSPVLEMQEDDRYTKPLGSNTPKLNLRTHLSVDKNGNTGDQGSSSADYDGFGTGMGWFPGYAINVETGERLNIMFGEDSWLINGNDMIWNPTDDLSSPLGELAIENGFGQPGVGNIPYWAGGKHYVYILGHNADDTTDVENGRGDVPAYDEGAYVRSVLDGSPSLNRKQGVFKDVMWVGLPLLAKGFKIDHPGQIPTNATVRIRVEKAYVPYFSTAAWTSEMALNDDHPMYSFDMTEFATTTRDLETAQSVLDDVKVVPNPYYAFSSYERSQTDNRVKITNLPVECIVSIYSVGGTLIRRFAREDHTITSIDWDLKNHASVPIASGVYFIHVNAPGIGETVVKWFGTLRPVDLDSF